MQLKIDHTRAGDAGKVDATKIAAKLKEAAVNSSLPPKAIIAYVLSNASENAVVQLFVRPIRHLK